jgi:F-type H+-transporting ATPase subunit b
MVDLTLLATAAATVAEHAGHIVEQHEEPTAWGFGPGAWVALSMLAVFGIMIYAKVPAIVAGMLDKQIAGIREQLAEAARLRSEAEALKAEYEKKVKVASKDADALKAAAEVEAKQIVAQAKNDATALIARRAKSAEDKIGAAERAAVADVRAKASAAAASAAAVLIAQRHDVMTDKAIIDQTIARLN